MLFKLINITTIYFAAMTTAHAGVAKSDGVKFTLVSKDSIETTCGKNFSFRDQHKSSVPPYLEPEVIKHSFRGTKFFVSLEATKKDALAGKKCLWFTDSEKGNLGL